MMTRQDNAAAKTPAPIMLEGDEARAVLAADMYRSLQVLHKQAEYSDFRMIAYLLRLAIIEAEEIVSDVALDEDE